jgi:acetyl esterase
VNKKKFQKKSHFYQRKGVLWPVGIFFGVIILVLAAFRFSPWPGALVIRYEFNKNGAKTLQAMEKHTPLKPVAVVSDQSYRAGDKNALLDVYYPEGTKSNAELPVVIWTHGGAWLSGDKTDDTPYFKLIAEMGFVVVGLNYSLAPGATYPTPILELNDAYAYLEANALRLHADLNKVILAGDSAGANLSAQMAAIITNPSYADKVGVTPLLKPSQLKGIVLNCGIYKMEELAVPDPTLPKLVGWGNDVTVWAYSGTRDFSDPVLRQMSPYYYVTKDFPPTYISGGNADPLTNLQSKPLAEKLRGLKVGVTSLFFPADHKPALSHEYQFNLDNSDGQKALAATLSFMKEQVKN